MKAIVLLAALIFPSQGFGEQADEVSGPWLYRSFINDPSPVGGDSDRALGLIFGEGILRLNLNSADRIGGTIEFGGAYLLDISGEIRHGGNAPLLIFRGTGRKGTPTEGWIYDYQAFPAPQWPNGVNQRHALVGTVIRSVRHGNGAAGFTASFVAVQSQ